MSSLDVYLRVRACLYLDSKDCSLFISVLLIPTQKENRESCSVLHIFYTCLICTISFLFDGDEIQFEIILCFPSINLLK